MSNKKTKKVELSILRNIKNFQSPKNKFELTLGRRQKESTIYKYMTIEALKLSFGLTGENGQSIMFVEPSCWSDQYERRFYMANYKLINPPPCTTPKLYASCFTFKDKSDAAWKVYRKYKKNDDDENFDPDEGFCAKITIKREGLTKALCNCEDSRYNVYEGFVDYTLSLALINSLHQSSINIKDSKGEIKTIDNNRYYEIFGHEKDEFKLDNYLSLLSIKRNIFEYEKEYRYFLIEKSQLNDCNTPDKKGETRIFPKIKWRDFIEKIEVDDQYPDDKFRELIRDINNKEIIDSSKITKEDINKMDGLIKIERRGKKKSNL